MTEFNSKIKKNSRILKIFMFSICALFACAISSHAQSLVKGTVTDGIGEPLPGVSVVVKGTTNGTITDVNGKLIYTKVFTNSKNLYFSIKEPAGIYIVSVKAGDKQAAIRLIKE